MRGDDIVQPYIGGVPSYGIFSSIGLFCMMMILYLRNKKLSFGEYLFLMASMIIGVGIGSKLLFFITQIPDIIANFSIKYLIKKIITSGFVFYGGLFGAIIGCIVFSRLRNYDVRKMLNYVAPGYSIFHACGRIGCFFSGCCYGKEATWGLPLWNEPETLRIPVQLIEAIFLLSMTLFLLILEKKGKSNIFEIYLVGYAIFRFIIEFWRGDKLRGIWICFSTSQWISIIIIISFILYRATKIYRKTSKK